MAEWRLLLKTLFARRVVLIALVLLAVFGQGSDKILLALVAVQWAYYARTIRAQAIIEKTREYIEAARMLRYSTSRIVLRHLLPNCLPPLIVVATVQVASAIALEATLSFLGLGVQPPMSSWGVLIKDGAEKMEEFPWLLVFPGTVFSLTLFSLNFLGDGLRDALDVRSSKD